MKSSKFQSLIVFAAMALTLTACSMEASIQSLVDTVKTLKVPGQAQGITSGSVEAQTASGGQNYIVYGSVGVVGGSSASSMMIHTTNNYKVYSTVQGAIIAE